MNERPCFKSIRRFLACTGKGQSARLAAQSGASVSGLFGARVSMHCKLGSPEFKYEPMKFLNQLGSVQLGLGS